LCEAAIPALNTAGMDAESLWPHLDGGEPTDDRWAVFGTVDGWPGARRGMFKYFRHPFSGQGVLFDLESDPGETTNLFTDDRYRDRALDLAVGLQLYLERPPVDV
jgi:hypothetical protein